MGQMKERTDWITWLLAYILIHPPWIRIQWNVTLLARCVGPVQFLCFALHLHIIWHTVMLDGGCCAATGDAPSTISRYVSYWYLLAYSFLQVYCHSAPPTPSLCQSSLTPPSCYTPIVPVTDQYASSYTGFYLINDATFGNTMRVYSLFGWFCPLVFFLFRKFTLAPLIFLYFTSKQVSYLSIKIYTNIQQPRGRRTEYRIECTCLYFSIPIVFRFGITLQLEQSTISWSCEGMIVVQNAH